ncbi:hypothetical protein [Burkholderia ubonensis]|uniref:hypothetical protein n=1 Tax=Burkholderia ubonensis TaxID=101571 RepID=UPI000A6C244E|nr:hypothetical protein [Burkholderia ubonensis]
MKGFASIATLTALMLFASMIPARADGISHVHLQNSAWSSVNVEVRRGNAGSCDQNPVVNKTAVPKGGELVVDSNGEDVCWRRDTDPDHPNGQWTGWSNQSVFAGDGRDYYENL